MYRLWGLGAVLLLLVACSKIVSKENSHPLEIKKDNDIHYEHFNEHGEFVEHQVLKDPKSDEYTEGIVAPNNLSRYETIHGDGQSNRIDLVVVGDGYALNDLSRYREQTQNIIDQYFLEEPLLTYRNYFNVHRVDVISQESGIDHDPGFGIQRSTALDMQFHCYNLPRMLCVNVQKAKSYAANAPKVDQILAIANSTSYGGTGYWNDRLATMSGGNEYSAELALHELAHSFAQLGDEYDYAGSDPKTCLNKANGSVWGWLTMMTSKIKWYRWLDIPHIGAFEGTCYQRTNAFRPSENSKMRTLGHPFHEVNSEQYIFQIYKHVRPIQMATPSGTYSKSSVFYAYPVQPIGYSLEIKWFLDGREIPGSDQKLTLSVPSLNLPKRTRHTISVRVTDKTTKVRDQEMRQRLMTETRSWTVR